MQTLNDAITGYLSYLRTEQGASPRTVRGYQYYLRRFSAWIAETKHSDNVADISIWTLRRYLSSVAHLRPRTRRGAFQPIRSLFAFLVTCEAISENPAAKVSMPKKDAAIRETVSREEARNLIAACERLRPAHRRALARAIMMVLCHTGLRRQELIDLRLDDLNLDDTPARVLVRAGKGSKSRRIPMSQAVAQAVREWLALRPQSELDYVWLYDHRRRIGHVALKSLVEDVKCAAGYEGNTNIMPHSLRHFAATNLMKNGANIKQIQTFLGHTRLTTTTVYLHVDEEDITELADLQTVDEEAEAVLKPSNSPSFAAPRRRRIPSRRK